MTLSTLLLVTLVSPALAVLPIGGVFGNEDGCRLYMTGSFDGAPVVITPYTFTSPDTRCTFAELAAREPGWAEVDASCSGIGHTTLRVENRGGDGVFVAVADMTYGPLSRCPGTEDLVNTEGMPV